MAAASAKAPSRVAVHVESSPGFDAFEPWHASLFSLFFDVALTRPESRQTFHGDVAGFHLGDCALFNSASVGHRHRRDPALIRRTGIDRLMIEYQTKGVRRGRFGERNVEIAPGNVSFLDFGRTVESEESDFSRVSLIVPRDRLPAALRERDLHGVVLDPVNGGTLARFLSVLARSVHLLGDATGAVDVALTLAQHALGRPSPLLSEARAAMRLLAKDFIARNLTGAGLTPAAIAAGIGVSRATLYRLFEEEGGIAAYLIAQRLDRCIEALLRRRHDSVGIVAMSHGFASESHFSRAFRRRYGVTPRDVRGLARAAASRPEARDDGVAALTQTRDWVRELGAKA